MWRPWGKSKSTTRIHSASSSPSFSCSSFKDIQTLCLDEPPPQPSPSPIRKSTVFHRVRLANSLLRTWSTHSQNQNHHHHQQQQQQPKLPRTLSYPDDSLPDLPPSPSPAPEIYLPGTENRVVVYFTSLRVVRPTFEGCKSVLAILRGFRVRIDERDVSMDSAFTAELIRVMGRSRLTLPRVFIGGRYVGGAEEVRQMNEVGELKKILKALPEVDPAECDVCGGHRFVLCDECFGSRKVFTEKAGFRVCIACNENGLVRCPSCFDDPILL